MHTQRCSPQAKNDTAEQDETKNAHTELDGDPIIAELRKLYDVVVDEPLPGDLTELLRRLDEIERNR